MTIVNPYVFAAAPGPSIESFAFTPLMSFNTVHAVPMPATVAPGDLLVVSLTNRNGYTTSTPAGWTSRINVNDTAGSGMRTYVFSKVATGAEGGTSVNFTLSRSSYLLALVVRLSGTATTGTYWASAGKHFGGGATSIAPNNLAAPWGAADTLWMNIAFGYFALTPTQYPLPDNQSAYFAGANEAVYFASKEQNIATLVPSPIRFPSTQYGGVITIGVRPL